MSVTTTVITLLAQLYDIVQFRLPPGPKFVPINWVLNTQKFGCWIWLLCLMIYYDNWSRGAWIYFFLHGTYGLSWIVKDLVFPDVTFRQKVTFGSALILILVLITYLLPGYQMMSRVADNNPSKERIITACVCYIVGIFLMIGADLQKNYILKLGGGLISTGFFKTTRNPNYLGEMLIYSSFAIICGRWEFWMINIFVWLTLFLPRMVIKDISLAKKKGWENYDSYMLLPKLSSSHLDNFIIYSSLAILGLMLYKSCMCESNFSKCQCMEELSTLLKFYQTPSLANLTKDLKAIISCFGDIELFTLPSYSVNFMKSYL
ncbi:unnamed protein product [Moneuplotes crassus]|uniref:Steroid 5-alpha reductase C-terminal domain-containing protein n=1 Tax=Euplotes crassus TaxID=5936 RepID=A0AAD2CYV0_EUPCR|nr:unnamed protein product [Moneuplotes crassus]